MLPFDELGTRMLDKLVAAGVGQRPVIFIAHSLGGLLAKEIMLQGSQAAEGTGRHKLTDATRGLAFYSVPHFGSWLADLGWRLKAVGGAPSPHVAQLRYGPHLEELNTFVRKLHKAKKLDVLSFLETGKTTLFTGITVEVVPLESAYPGYGDLKVMPLDHIHICKPSSREDPGYEKLLEFVRATGKQFKFIPASVPGAGGSS